MKKSKKNRVTEALDMVQNANESALLADGFNLTVQEIPDIFSVGDELDNNKYI